MKNKKIILGLGTITALGAMSMAFVACGLKDKDVNKRIDEFKQNELPNLIKFGVFESKLDDFFTDWSYGNKEMKKDQDPKDIGEFKAGSTVADLIKAIEFKYNNFYGRFELLSISNEEKAKVLKNTDTSYKFWIMQAKEDGSKTILKKEIEFKFKVK